MPAIQLQDPDLQQGLSYWDTQPATLDGVLGGFGNGTLPYVDALGSRQLLMSLRPDLCIFDSVLRPLNAPPKDPHQRIRALDLGAGIGRVTEDVLLHLCDDVVVVEPTHKFVQEAYYRSSKYHGISDSTKSAVFVQDTLQGFDPRAEIPKDRILARAGAPGHAKEDTFDVVWMQWCLGHTTDAELVTLLKRTKESLRDEKSVIVVKENVCSENEDGTASTVYDDQDSSVTRSNLAFIQRFKEAGLNVVRNEVQHGLPEGLFPVHMWALR